jgi:hypothetical protein
MDGRSFLPVLKAAPTRSRPYLHRPLPVDPLLRQQGEAEGILDDMVDNKGWSYKDEYGGLIKNMHLRSVQNERFGYIYNQWSDGKDEYIYGYNLTAGALRHAAQTTMRWRPASTSSASAHPRSSMTSRTIPSSLNNLIDDPAYAKRSKQCGPGCCSGWRPAKIPSGPSSSSRSRNETERPLRAVGTLLPVTQESTTPSAPNRFEPTSHASLDAPSKRHPRKA